ncbi:uncharacterized protein LOC106530083 [Austrofundulus limnaeus]|uniref:Uncharacterized protein LOC106530083 n=1 Tax=Austrofundulus limnaeus TaxID=52670 RepID=A0A2I4CMA1_AUSLI|nr:PREDICTED: uncharacterized protein LOC106530083 [Austrofundulus limnaeus]
MAVNSSSTSSPPPLNSLICQQEGHFPSSTSFSAHTDNMLGSLCTLITALTYVSGVTLVTQKPNVVTFPSSAASEETFPGQTDNMLWSLCAVITALTYVDAAKVLTQTPAVHTVSTGQQAVLNCNIQKDENYYVLWYKQVPGGTPQFILRFHHSHSSPDKYGTGFSSDRFTSTATSNIEYQFVIKQADTADSAVYHCNTWDNSTREHVSQ